MKELQPCESAGTTSSQPSRMPFLRPVGQNTARHNHRQSFGVLNGNLNASGLCASQPLFAWVRNAGATTTGTRELWVSCWFKCATSYDTPTRLAAPSPPTGELIRCPNVKRTLSRLAAMGKSRRKSYHAGFECFHYSASDFAIALSCCDFRLLTP
ncbi:hypothetical protein BV898_12032 [Hypsibius exemplaris]|uniref:Uncharacterized protein n=1 Tax=Hypsibius exemplaris TaxID=2072580 RepID=A0A1W0WET3_HYPEX|nr:hypothetical protein BV898_12032 [Hypsibius exemplaris]